MCLRLSVSLGIPAAEAGRTAESFCIFCDWWGGGGGGKRLKEP